MLQFLIYCRPILRSSNPLRQLSCKTHLRDRFGGTGVVMGEMDDIVREFIVESTEGLDQLDRDLVELEKDPSDGERLARIFRVAHTIKGTSGVLGFGKMEAVAHVGENLLSQLRDRKLMLTQGITSALLGMVDALRTLLADIEQSGTERQRDYSTVIANLSAQLAGGNIAAAAPPTGTAVSTAAVREAQTGSSSGDGTASSIRVDVGLIDKVMTLVGELVLARNQILQFTASEQDASFTGAAQRLNLITTELQEAVMKTRMQPIGNVWNKLPRVVRDLAAGCGKHVRIEMEGSDTELDKTIIEAIKDPLTHIVRNAVDHGIESPEKRRAAGKPEEGVLRLRAYHEGGQVNIEITDDGGGINVEAISERAKQRGLVGADQAARMSERELIAMIFSPGFSTAEKVTNVSGRGVGMDVVKTNIERIGGSVDVQSAQGAGTALKIKIPLTLAIIPALVATSGGERFAIPQVSLVELVRLDGEQGASAIESIQGAPVYRLRGNLLPLLYLDRELRLRGREKSEAVNIVVLQADDRQFGMVVDEINDTEEIVVKPLGKLLKGLPCFAGATIMGDGRVALILDVMGLAQRAQVVAESRARATAASAKTEDASKRSAWLLFRAGEEGCMAMPLADVARLEEFAAAKIEHSGAREVVQYRGDILPLVRVAEVLGKKSQRKEPVQVVVSSYNGRSFGLVVDEIQDITEQEVRVQDANGDETRAAIIQERVTDLANVEGLLAAVERATAMVSA